MAYGVEMRVEDLRRAATYWAVSCVLLRHWQEHLPADPPHDDDGDEWAAWAGVVARTEARFGGPARQPDSVSPDERSWIVDATNGLQDVGAVYAVAWGLGAVLGYTYAPAWRDEVRAGSGLVKRLEAGELYPVGGTPWQQNLAYSSKPAALSAPWVDELPCIRMHREADGDVAFDFRFDEALEAVFTNLTHVAALLPNEAWHELDLNDGDGLAFPIRPVDPAAQRQRVLRLIRLALHDRVRVSVLPELCRTQEDLDALQDRLADHDLPHLLMAGSHHVVEDGRNENVAVALLAGYPERMEHRKTTPFTDDIGPRPPGKEGIRRRKHLQVTVHQGGEFRFAMPICKELFDERMTTALDRLGANVLLVGAMSPKTYPFRAAIHGRVAGAQALVVVVNNPRCGPTGEPLEPVVWIGRPTVDRPVTSYLCAHPAPQKLCVPLRSETRE